MSAKQQPQPTSKQTKIEQYLSEYLGVHHFIWLKRGILGDDTDGHIDDLARFVNPNTIVCAYEDNRKRCRLRCIKENYDLLTNISRPRRQTTKNNQIPMPKVVSDEGYRYPQVTPTST